MFRINYINNEDGGELVSGIATLDEAKEICRKAFVNGDVNEADKLQIWSDEDDVTAAAEFTVDDLKISNDELREMAQVALDNWTFDSETDPDGDVKRGLEFLASEGNWDQEVIDARFERGDKWDALMDWAKFLGEK